MPAPVRSWREVLLAAGAEIGPAALVDLALGPLEEGLPVLREDPDLREAARRSAAANVELLLVVAQDDSALEDLEPPPAAVAFARELARRHVPVAELGRSYRLAQHALWQFAVGEIRARIADPDAVALAIEELSDSAFRAGDVISTTVMERYAEERERWRRSGEAVRRETVAELLAGRRVDVAQTSRRLGYELRAPHLAYVVWVESGDGSPATVAAAIGGPGALTVGLADGVVAGWAPPDAFAPARADPAERVRIAVGAPGTGIAGFRASHHQALEARRVAQLGGVGEDPSAPVRHADVALIALLTHDLPQARAFVATTLGPLAADDEGGRRLAATLRALLEEGGSPRRAGRRLGVHENTVAKRQAAIDRALPPEDRAGPAELLAALTLLDVLR